MLAVALASCNDFLDLEPPSYAVPEDYYQSEDQVQAATNQFYEDVLPSHSNWSYGTFGNDNGTDNQTSSSGQNKYGTDLWLTGSTDNYWSKATSAVALTISVTTLVSCIFSVLIATTTC